MLWLQEGRDPDYSEYKEFKLTVENIGFKMLMKMGWKEGEGLGSESQGIKNPVNRSGLESLLLVARENKYNKLKLM